MTSQQTPIQKAFTELVQATAPPRRPSMGGRTSSAPAGGLYNLDSRRSRPGTNVGQTLMEENEGPAVGSDASRRPVPQHYGDEVCLADPGPLRARKAPGRMIGLLTAEVPAGALEGKSPRSDHRCCRRRKCRQIEFHKMGIRHEMPAIFPFDQEEDVIRWGGLHSAFAGD